MPPPGGAAICPVAETDAKLRTNSLHSSPIPIYS